MVEGFVYLSDEKQMVLNWVVDRRKNYIHNWLKLDTFESKKDTNWYLEQTTGVQRLIYDRENHEKQVVWPKFHLDPYGSNFHNWT